MTRARALGWVAILALAGCQLLLGIEDEPLAASPDGGGASSSGLATSSGVQPAGADCDPSVTALPPSPSDAGADLPDLPNRVYFAVRRIGFGEADAAAAVGFDVDRRYTGHEGSVTTNPACLSPTGKVRLDGPGGIDNGLFQVLEGAVPQGATLVAGLVNSDMEIGRGSIVLEVIDWNGSADDPAIQGAFTTSVGVVDGAPKWDGSDVFTHASSRRDADKRVPPSAYVAEPQKGYVTSGTAVVLSEGTLDVPLLGGTLKLERGVAVASLQGAVRQRTLRGSFAGTVDPFAVYALLHPVLLQIGGSWVRVCETELGKDMCEALVSGLDVAEGLGCEVVDPAAPCARISVALSFEAYEIAGLGDYVPLELNQGVCAGTFDPASRACPSGPLPRDAAPAQETDGDAS